MKRPPHGRPLAHPPLRRARPHRPRPRPRRPRPKVLDGVFCFGADLEESLAKANAAKGAEDDRAKVLGAMKAADAFVQAGRFQDAAREVDAAQGLIRQLRFDEGRACAMVVVAKLYARQGAVSTAEQLDEALDLASDAQEKFQKYGSKRCEAAALLALSMARHAVKRHEEGNLAAKDAQLLLQGLGDRPAEAEVYQVVAEGFLLQGNVRRAVKMLSQARSIHQALGDRRKEAACCHRIGQAEAQGHDEQKALAALSTSQAMYRDAGDCSGEAAVLQTVKDMHLKKRKLNLAIEVLQRIVTLYNHAGETKSEGGALLALTELLIEEEQLTLAERTVQAGLKVCSNVRDGDGVVRATNLANTIKNALLKREVRQSIEQYGHFANYPVQPVLDFGLSGQVPGAFAEVARGL